MKPIKVLCLLYAAVCAVLFGGFCLTRSGETDTDQPVITMDQTEIEVSMEATDEDLLKGIRARDPSAGDVTDTLMVEQLSDFAEDHTRTMTVAAFDNAGNVAKATRTIRYSDYTSPVFSLSAPFVFQTNVTNYLTALTAEDCFDGDLTANIRTSTDTYIEYWTPGDYQALFYVTNSAGDRVELPVTVTIYDPANYGTIPFFALSEYLIRVPVGSSPVDAFSYLDTVTIGGAVYRKGNDGSYEEESVLQLHQQDAAAYEQLVATKQASNSRYEIKPSEITVTDGVDYQTPGYYEITYTLENGGQTGVVRLIVEVQE